MAKKCFYASDQFKCDEEVCLGAVCTIVDATCILPSCCRWFVAECHVHFAVVILSLLFVVVVVICRCCCGSQSFIAVGEDVPLDRSQVRTLYRSSQAENPSLANYLLPTRSGVFFVGHAKVKPVQTLSITSDYFSIQRKQSLISVVS